MPRRRRRSPMSRARQVAQRVFRVPGLRPEQELALAALLDGRDVLAVLPTGSGKSLLYQVPTLVRRRPTVVVSPLLALMQDQERKLRRAGVPVVRLDSTLRVAERREALERVDEDGTLVVLTTPETLGAAGVQQALADARVGLLAVDEAHCISEWGHDFRPSYLRLVAARRVLGNPQVLALTATATERVREQIERSLGLVAPVRILAPPHRENLRLSAEVLSEGEKPARVGQLLRSLRRPGIVYCATTATVDLLYVALRRAGVPATHYHGRMRAADRLAHLTTFMRPRHKQVMVATSAFGMGIDKPDIRFVIHYQAPASIEQYVQEAGRAGRDGRPADCILLFSEEDLEVQRRLLARSRTSPAQLLRVAHALRAWASERGDVTADELALSAMVPRNTAASLLATLEQTGAVEEVEGRFRPLLPGPGLEAQAHELARRLETQRTLDRRRLEAVREYALTDGCRSAFLRRYFDEPDAPPCGTCDRCRAAGLRRPARAVPSVPVA